MKYRKQVFGMLVLCLVGSGTIYTIQNKKSMSEVVEIQSTEEKKQIAITFDDGPSLYTEELLDGLLKRNVKASFFLIGNKVEEFPDIVKREKEEGHLIGNHTYSHVDISKVSEDMAKEELGKTNQALENILGEGTIYVRPPFGIRQKKLESELELIPVMWSIDPLDWTTENVTEIVNKVVTEADENDIILMHDCYKSSVEAALRIIDILQKENFEFVTVEELLIR